MSLNAVFMFTYCTHVNGQMNSAALRLNHSPFLWLATGYHSLYCKCLDVVDTFLPHRPLITDGATPTVLLFLCVPDSLILFVVLRNDKLT